MEKGNVTPGTQSTSATQLPAQPTQPTQTGMGVRKPGETGKGLILRILSAIFVIFVVLVIFTIFSQYGNVKAHKAKINASWPTYRCKPHVMPFAGWLVGPPGVSGLGNFLECSLLIFKNSFLRFMTPIFAFLDSLLNVVLDLVRSIENVRKMINYMRVSIRSFLLDIGNMLYGYGKKISYLFNRLLKTFSLVFDTFYYLFYTLAYSIYTVAAVWNSPIGGVARYWCFRASTPVAMANGKRVAISQLKVGDKTLMGGAITATMKLPGKTVPLYAYPVKNNDFVFVSGDHLVKEGSKWIRVCDSPKVIQTNTCEDEIYCLCTERGKIMTGGVVFSDWQEADTTEQFRLIRKMILDTLNENKATENHMKLDGIDRVWGLDGSVKVNLEGGKTKTLADLQLGDTLENGGNVEGLIQVFGGAVDQFLYKGTICSGDVVVKEDGQWIPVRRSIEAIYMKQKKAKLYHLLTSENIMNIGSILCTDFDQTLNTGVNAEIDSFVERCLNKENRVYG